MPLLPKRSCIAFKIETTAGTAETLTAAEAAFNAYEHSAVPNVPMGLRQGQLAYSGLLAIPGTRSATISFQTDLYTAPGWESMLGACGLVEGSADIWTVSSVTTNLKTATIARYKDGKVYRIKGAMGTFSMQFRPGQVTRVLWTFTGVIDAWGTDATLLDPTLPLTAASAPRFASATTTVGGNALYFGALDINLNNTITLLEDGGTGAAGFYRAWISDRLVGGSIDPEEALAATRNDHGFWLTPTEQALSLAYASMSISIPKLQYLTMPDGDRNGAAVLNATWQANRSGTAGDDELVIDLSTA
jgi:hypothetical protein